MVKTSVSGSIKGHVRLGRRNGNIVIIGALLGLQCGPLNMRQSELSLREQTENARPHLKRNAHEAFIVADEGAAVCTTMLR